MEYKIGDRVRVIKDATGGCFRECVDAVTNIVEIDSDDYEHEYGLDFGDNVLFLDKNITISAIISI